LSSLDAASRSADTLTQSTFGSIAAILCGETDFSRFELLECYYLSIRLLQWGQLAEARVVTKAAADEDVCVRCKQWHDLIVYTYSVCVDDASGHCSDVLT
jgi:hypothetical protein